MKFAYYPYDETVRATDFEFAPLPDIGNAVKAVSESDLVEDRWFYAPAQPVARRAKPRPYSSRVFGLKSTHELVHRASNDQARLSFLMHCFGFFEGMRFDESGAGFLDATPIVRNMLNDFRLYGDDLACALDSADAFWNRHAAAPELATRLLGVFQSLSLAQRPQSLAFERFLYAYTALEGCFAVGRGIHNVPSSGGHAARTNNLCNSLNIPVPPWMTNGLTLRTVATRNAVIHEGLFLDQPLGYASFHGADVPDVERAMTTALPSAMVNLVCRLVIALLGLRPEPYLQSSTYENAPFKLEL